MERNDMTDSGPIYSALANDEDMAELVEMFVGDLEERATSLEEASAVSDQDQLKMLAHQLKGSAGSYGFQIITDVAAKLEAAVNNGATDEVVESALAELTDLCRRATCAAEPQS